MTRAVRLSPPSAASLNLQNYLEEFFNRIGEGPLKIQGVVVADLTGEYAASKWGSTSATDPWSSILFCSDETGGATLIFSDGTNWRRTSDNAIAS